MERIKDPTARPANSLPPLFGQRNESVQLSLFNPFRRRRREPQCHLWVSWSDFDRMMEVRVREVLVVVRGPVRGC